MRLAAWTPLKDSSSWKPLWGSIIIIAASIFYVTVAGVDGPPIFAVPGFLVSALYLINWFVVRRNQINAV